MYRISHGEIGTFPVLKMFVGTLHCYNLILFMKMASTNQLCLYIQLQSILTQCIKLNFNTSQLTLL